MKTVSDHMVDHYNAQHLSEDTVQDLITATHRADQRRRWRRAAVTLLAAAAVLIVVLFGPLRPTPLERAAKEVAHNHYKQPALEVLTDDYAAAGEALRRLRFTPTAPARLEDRGLEMLGARYCSIQDHLAVQVRLTDADSRLYTLYETRLTTDLEDLTGEIAMEGVRIEIWQEDGLLFALASPTRAP